MADLRDRIYVMRDKNADKVEAPAVAHDDKLKTCPICGQRFDTRNLDHVYHHGPDPHAPLIDES